MKRETGAERGLSLLGVLLLIAVTLGCGAGQSQQPTEPPSAAPTSPPVSTITPTPRVDVPTYKNSFENLSEPAGSGITSANNEIRINTENVDYQSGSRSLEATGTLAGPAFSALTIDLSVQELTGQATVDLSDKTLGFSIFVPANSPIDNVVLVAKSRGGQVNLVADGGYTMGAQDREQGTWHHRQFDLASVYTRGAWTWTDLPQDAARKVVENCDTITFAAMRISDGEPATTSFLIDDLNWIASGDPAIYAADHSAESIRKYADQRGLKVGAVLFHDQDGNWYDDPWYRYTLGQQFNLTTVGGVSAPDTRPADLSAINFDYAYEDEKLAFAESHGMSLRGGTGANYAWNPQWILDASVADLKAFLVRKIEQDVGHFKGKMISWGLFNEPIDDDAVSLRNRQKKGMGDPPPGPGAPYGWHYSPFVDGRDISLIEEAFITAHRVDPNAKLFINEFNDEELGKPKSETLYKLLVGMKNHGIPVDGAGFELHLIYPAFPYTPDLEDLDGYLSRVDQNIKRYAAAGMWVEFTEVECQIRLDDIDLSTTAGQTEYSRRAQKQADVYAGLMKLAINNPNVLSVTFWTIADKPGTSAWDSFGNPFPNTDSFLFDKNYNPKPAYFAVLDVLKP